ncbi:retromer subunit VPS35 [Cyberlindnera jadinii NRRL Y-1542]|uniref:Vacuolar protein sorting-associated protein 35 n=1 Tax=Cyberlindnera jadinii (strain ATCC 18201 / CBS 1600 / BCRC 20928 / JCM 3617 / NBRC 0987 / NRRL Y-1542) TaxID=983966 RepID=A0A1E4RY89_CYBJN|nr:vacuolar protein sorting-associated protein 35 [Cyberlindnera jadinii NRRL Y-1542]ODV72253.1 vacuolar protein sorting-associated protein 35 [Cyberlindnera jadinii NRRL Y-1542]
MADTMSTEEQAQLLKDAIATINSETQLMKRCLETRGKLMDALKHASNFLMELRTSQLTPKQYYELYIMVFDSLNLLAGYLRDTHPHHHLADLYELVQYAGNIVPRLYLMITVGTVYMTTEDAPVQEILKDMIEMCRGVQYPIRGLFLRYYLQQRTKNLLPESQESVQFVIQNFIEMNKLWVRLQHQGPSKDRAKRTKEREELRILVGSNLVRLSQLDNDKDYYKTQILPIVLEQIIQCKDVLAQEYLLDVVIQVFPDEYHLYTLDEYLNCIKDLNPNVSLRKVLITLVNRLTDFAKREEINDLSISDGTEQHEKFKLDFNLFDKFWFYINELDKSRELSIEEIGSLLESVSRLTLAYYPSCYDNIDQLFKFATDKIKDVDPSSTVEIEQDFEQLLLTPVKLYPKLLDVLKLSNFINLLNSQTLKTQKSVSLEILNKLLLQGIKIKTVDDVTGIFKLLRVIITSVDKEQDANGEESLDYINEQEKLAKLVHLVWNKDTNVHANLLTSVKGVLSEGNIRHTYPSLFFNTLRLARRNKNGDLTNSLFKFISRIINDLYRVGLSDLSFKFYLSSAVIADQIQAEEFAYEFFAQCFTIYEESISDSRSQYQAIVSISGSLQQCRNFSRDNYDTLITKTALHSSKLLKKPDQCRAVYLASHLWWGVEIPALGEEEGVTEFYRDGKRVLECLQRSLRVADMCMDSGVSIELFVEILNRCLYYFIHGNESISIKYINGLIELIQTNIDTLSQENSVNENPKKHFERTLEYITSQKDIDDRFQLITW